LYEPIRVSTLEHAFHELSLGGDDVSELAEEEREQWLALFPHSAVVECSYPELDFATRWCWQNFGPCHGECHENSSEYPGCPLVISTERTEIVGGRERKRYAQVALHRHDGAWAKSWLGKTGYNYGFCEYYFADASSC